VEEPSLNWNGTHNVSKPTNLELFLEDQKRSLSRFKNPTSDRKDSRRQIVNGMADKSVISNPILI
jgi:hypothetical protein